MKLWHDDIRQSPEGWEWARTNAEAVRLLTENDVEEVSLDHDLGLDYLQPGAETVNLRGESPDGTGLDLVKWMVENDKMPPKVTIHSWSPVGARRMADTLADAGHRDITIRPYSGRD